MKKYKLNINNLDCVNCARSLEEELRKDKRFTNLSINFATSKLSYETDFNISFEEINNLVKRIEPGTYLTLVKQEKNSDYHNLIIILFLAIFLGIIGNYFKIDSLIIIAYL